MNKLNLGCQVHYFDGWINQEIVTDDKDIKAEIYSDASNLPIDSGTIGFIYAGHLIEHYFPDTVDRALQEWYRVLNVGGKLVIVTPDCGKCFKMYAEGKFNIESVYQQVYGRIYAYDRPEERHHMIFDSDSLRSRVEGAVFPGRWRNIENFNFNDPPEELVPFMDTHISRSNLQLGLILTK